MQNETIAISIFLFLSFFLGRLFIDSKATSWCSGRNHKRNQLLPVPSPHSQGTAVGLPWSYIKKHDGTICACKSKHTRIFSYKQQRSIMPPLFTETCFPSTTVPTMASTTSLMERRTSAKWDSLTGGAERSKSARSRTSWVFYPSKVTSTDLFKWNGACITAFLCDPQEFIFLEWHLLWHDQRDRCGSCSIAPRRARGSSFCALTRFGSSFLFCRRVIVSALCGQEQAALFLLIRHLQVMKSVILIKALAFSVVYIEKGRHVSVMREFNTLSRSCEVPTHAPLEVREIFLIQPCPGNKAQKSWAVLCTQRVA